MRTTRWVWTWGCVVVASAAVLALGDDAQKIEQLEQSIREQEARLAALERDVPAGGRTASEVLLSGEGAVGYFDTGARGAYPDGEFRIDEAKLFLDARLLPTVFFFAELNIREREEQDGEDVRFGELYIELEDLAGAWCEDLVNVRLGRFDIPFGEEYAQRDAIDNPLISHSLADPWGFDEGVCVYGRHGTWDYAFAVQNGGNPATRDYNSDKSVAIRIGVEPAEGWRASVSAYRTGDLDVQGDEMSEMWFGNGIFIPIGAPETTSSFEADMEQADVRYAWGSGRALATVGRFEYDDNDAAADHACDGWYASMEAVQDITRKLYAAVRGSRIEVDDGYPLVGQGSAGVLFQPDPPAIESLWRVSAGLGYRWDKRLVTKIEYSFERGEYANGSDVEDRDMASVQQAFRF